MSTRGAVVVATGIAAVLALPDGVHAAELDASPDGGADATADVAAAAGDAGRTEEVDVRAVEPAPALPALQLAPVRGDVIARGAGRRRIRAANVMIDGETVAETDAQGRFEAMTSPGRHHLQVAASGFTLSDVVVDVEPDGWRGTVRLDPGGPVYETVIAGKQSAAVVRLTGEEARNTPGAGGDPFRSIESLPGVSQIAWPFALYAIRGANPGNTGFFIDGLRVPALFHFALGPSIVHPYLIEKISFYPGGYPARLGGYVSGAITADTAAPPNDVRRFMADIRLYDAGGLAVAPWHGGRGTVAVAARYSFTGLLVSRLFSGVSFGYADYQLRADHTLGGGRVTLLALGSFDSLNIERNQIGDAELDFHRLDLRWERPTAGGRLLIRTTFATDRANSQLYDSPIGVRAYTVAPRVSFTQPLDGVDGALEIGTDAEAQRFFTDVVIMPDTPPLGDLAQTRDALTVGTYAAATLNWRRFGLDPGLRYAHYYEQETGKGSIEPRLAARLRLTDKLTLEGTVGRFSQMPSLPLSVAGFEAFGLRDFGLQTSTQTALGVDARLANDLQLRVTGFHQWLFVSDLLSTFSRDFRSPEFLEMRSGRGYGVELMVRLPQQGKVTGWLAYTLSWSLRDFDGVYAASDWDQRHILNLVGTVKLPRGWSAGGRFHYHTGRPYPVQSETLGPPDYFRLPDFWQLDLRGAKRVVLDRSTLDFYVELGNATLTRQVVAIQRQLQEGAPPEHVGFRIVLPSIGVHAEW